MSAPRHRLARHVGPHVSGFSLVELMVALAISLFLFSGALYVFSKTREQYRAIDAVSRNQENARYAMSVLENDLRLAGYWGLHGQSDLVSVTDDVADDTLCGPDFNPTAVNVREYVAAGAAIDLPCANNRAAGTEALIIRRSSVDPVPPEVVLDTVDPPAEPTLVPGTIYVQNSFVSSLGFKGTTVPAPYDSDTSNTHLFVTHAYYISSRSDADANTPALRRVSIVSGPGIVDEEIIPGVETMQVEMGIDTNGDRAVDAYVDPTAYAGETLLATRVILTVRAEQRELGVGADDFRRATLSKTIELRNERR